MLKIGEFSKLSRVSIRMLRHYDDIGLLKPAEIDSFTGYRYYHEEQLFDIGRITSLNDTEHVKFKTLPEVKVASCIIKGSYDQMGEAYATVASWIKANGYKMNGPMFNIYHVSPAQTQNPDEYVTEACFPIE